MKNLGTTLMLASASVVIVGMSGARAEDPPAWAFPVNPPGLVASKDDGKTHTLPGSTAKFSFSQLHDFFNPPDWYADDHPPMPSLVAHGALPATGVSPHIGTGGRRGSSLLRNFYDRSETQLGP